MTSEELAIVYFKDMRKRMCEDHLKICPKDSVAYRATLIEKGFYDAAIKSLEQKPCEDAVSKEDVLAEIIRFSTEEGASVECQQLYCDVNNMPPVTPATPAQRWIPVSERLPEENKTVIASTKYGVYSEARYTKEDGWEWAYESGADYWVELEYVTAWMPLPESYKGESEDKE